MGRNGDEYAADLAPPSTNNSVNRNNRISDAVAPNRRSDQARWAPTHGATPDGIYWQYVVKGMLRLAAVYVDVYRKNNG
jgi:hypothetical protein